MGYSPKIFVLCNIMLEKLALFVQLSYFADARQSNILLVSLQFAINPYICKVSIVKLL